MISILAPAKLTLSLEITGVRSDGYHLLKAEMVSVSLMDKLEISEGEGISVTCLLYTSPSPRDYAASRMPSSA